jgi:hypothetical protein
VMSDPSCMPQNPSTCPATMTAATGVCTTPPGNAAFCDYPEGRCGCIACEAGDLGATSSAWVCRPWSDVPSGCAATAPRAGEACTVPNQSCDYSRCCGVGIGPDLVCIHGLWQPTVNTGCSCRLPTCP